MAAKKKRRLVPDADAVASSGPQPQAALSWPVIAIGTLCLVAVVSQAGSAVQAQAVDAAAVALGIAGALAAAVVATGDGFSLRTERLTLSVLALLGWAAVSVALSGRVWSALVGEANFLLGFAAIAAMAAIALFGRSSAQGARRFVIAVAPWAVMVQIAVVGVQVALGEHGSGTLPNSTYMGEFVLLMLPWVLAVESSKTLSRPIRLTIAVLSVVMLGAAGARVAAVVALAWIVVAVIGRSRLSANTKVWATAAAVAAVLVAGLVFARGELIGTAGVETLGERPGMWAVAARAVAARPVFGSGPDGFIAGGAAILTPELAEGSTVVTFRPGAADPHNILIWVAVSLGVVGLGLFLWVCVEVARRWRFAHRRGLDVTPAIWAVGGAMAVFLTAPAAIEVLPMFALVLGLSLERAAEDGSGARVWPRAASLAVVGVLGVTSLALAANAATRFGLEEYGPEVSPSKAAAVQRASTVWSVDPHLAYLASLHLGYSAAQDPVVASQRLDLDAIRRAAALDTRNPFYALEYARTLKFYGSPAGQVEAAFLKVFERYPAYPLARAEYAAFLAEQGRFAEAAEQVRIAQLVPDQDPGRIGAIEAAQRLIDAGQQ